MDRRLRVLIRLDLDRTSAVIHVTGCLTVVNHRALVPIIRRTTSLAGGLNATVDLTRAKHIEAAALDLLEVRLGSCSNLGSPQRRVATNAPDALPDCPAGMAASLCRAASAA